MEVYGHGFDSTHNATGSRPTGPPESPVATSRTATNARREAPGRDRTVSALPNDIADSRRARPRPARPASPCSGPPPRAWKARDASTSCGNSRCARFRRPFIPIRVRLELGVGTCLRFRWAHRDIGQPWNEPWGHASSCGSGMKIRDALRLIDRLDRTGRIIIGGAVFCRKTTTSGGVEKRGERESGRNCGRRSRRPRGAGLPLRRMERAATTRPQPDRRPGRRAARREPMHEPPRPRPPQHPHASRRHAHPVRGQPRISLIRPAHRPVDLVACSGAEQPDKRRNRPDWTTTRTAEFIRIGSRYRTCLRLFDKWAPTVHRPEWS